jgi:acetoin utilization protein AcuB
MLVKDYMTRHPLMAEPGMSVVEAQRYMAENGIRHLPIIGDGKRFVGLVTRERLLMDPTMLGSLDIWEIVRSVTDITVADVMVKAEDVVTIEPDVTIEQAARVMVKRGIGSLPVLEENIVVGMITDTDIMAQLSEMMVAQPPVPNVRVTVRIPNQPGELAKLVGAVASQGWGILACGGVLYAKDPTKWDAVVKLSFVTKEEAVPVLEKIEGHEILDVREAQP